MTLKCYSDFHGGTQVLQRFPWWHSSVTAVSMVALECYRGLVGVMECYGGFSGGTEVLQGFRGGDGVLQGFS